MELKSWARTAATRADAATMNFIFAVFEVLS